MIGQTNRVFNFTFLLKKELFQIRVDINTAAKQPVKYVCTMQLLRILLKYLNKYEVNVSLNVNTFEMYFELLGIAH